jgi:hypothetical protein
MRVPILAVMALFLSGPLALSGEEPAAADTVELKKKLLKAIDSRSNDDVRSCLAELVKAGGKENMETILKLLPKIPESEDSMYWDLIQGACSFQDGPAMEHLGETIVRLQRGPTARDLIYGLAKNRSTGAVLALAPVLKGGQPDLQVMAAVKLGTILVPEAVDALIEALKREEKKETDLRDAIVEGLKTITGQDYRMNVVNWEGWWKANREKPLLGPRAREREGWTGTVVDDLDSGRKKEFKGLETAPKKSVVVLSASFPQRDVNNDHIENVLQRMGIPHVVVKRPDFEKYSLRGVGAIIVNCAQFHEFCICPTCKPSGPRHNRLRTCSDCEKHIKFCAKLNEPSIKKIQDFVKRGGYLFLEDWTVKEVLERAFPQYATAGKVLKEDKVDVVPARGRASHAFLKGVFRPDKPPEREEGEEEEEEEGGEEEPRTKPVKPESEGGEVGPELVKVKHHWLVDDESWALKIVDTAKTVVLLTSGKLQKKTNGEGVVAFFFRPGGDVAKDEGAVKKKVGRKRPRAGLVLQVLSHFGKQESEDDEYALQNILVNFLIAANAQNGGIVPGEKPSAKKPSKKEEKAAKKEEKPAEEDGEEPGEEGEPSGE